MHEHDDENIVERRIKCIITLYSFYITDTYGESNVTIRKSEKPTKKNRIYFRY